MAMEIRVIERDDVSAIEKLGGAKIDINLINLQIIIENEPKPLSFDDVLRGVREAGALVGRLANGDISISTFRRILVIPKGYGIADSVTGQINRMAISEALGRLAGF